MLPQLKTEAYTSQIFWLCLCFLMLYIAMRYVIWPKMQHIKQQREDLLQQHVRDIERLRHQTEDLVKKDAMILRKTQQEARSIIDQTLARATEDYQRFCHDLDQQYKAKLDRLQHDLDQRKVGLLNDMSSVSGTLEKALHDKVLVSPQRRE